MAKQVKKKTATSKKKPILAAAKKKTAAKKAAAPQPVKKAKPTKEAPQEGFMWKLLKKKEAERKQLQEQKKTSKFNMHASNQLPTGIQGFSRFAGPRRKAA